MPTTSGDRPRVAFVCVQNAGRSQMSAALAERAADRRGLDVEVVSGGTDPADAVHDVVVDAMAEVGLDLSDRVPREVDPAELATCDVVITMGCSTLDLEADVDVRDWGLPDPHGEDLESVRALREEIDARVTALLDEVAVPAGESGGTDSV